MNQKTYVTYKTHKTNKSKSGKTQTKTRQVTNCHSANKISASAHKDILNKTLDGIYTKMIQSKNTQNYTWKRSFIDLLGKEKGIDIKQSDLIPKSINEKGSMTMRNYKFWFLYLEYLKKNLTFNKLLCLTRYAMSFLNKTKDIKMLKILFAALIREIKVSDREIDNYCKTNHILKKKKDQYYDYLFCNGFCDLEGDDNLKIKRNREQHKENNCVIERAEIRNQSEERVIVKDNSIRDEENNELLILPLNISHSEFKTELTPVLKEKLESSPIIKVFDEKSICDDIEKIKSILKEDKEISIQQTASPHSHNPFKDKQIDEGDITLPQQNPLIKHNIYTANLPQTPSSEKHSLNESMIEQKKFFSFNEQMGMDFEMAIDSNQKHDSNEDDYNNSLEDSYIKYLKEKAANKYYSNIDQLANIFNEEQVNDKENHNKVTEIETDDKNQLTLTPMPPHKRKSIRLLEALTPLSNTTYQSRVHIFRFKYNIK